MDAAARMLDTFTCGRFRSGGMLMGAILVVSVVLSLSVQASPAQTPSRPAPATLESLRIELERLKAELSELRAGLLRRGILLERFSEPISIVGRPSAGDPHAPLVLIEFTDFECPFCARHANSVLHKLTTRYIDTKLLEYVVMSFPLEENHPIAFRAALAAECAQRQQRYWVMHDLLFRNPAIVADVSKLVAQADLEGDRFDACLRDVSAAIQVRREIGEAQRLGIDGTPTFVLGKRLPDAKSVRPEVILSGVQPIERFDAAIAPMLKALGGAHSDRVPKSEEDVGSRR